MSTFRDKFWTVFASLLTAGGVSYGTAITTKPAPVTVMPPTVIVNPVASSDGAGTNSRATQRKVAAMWGELDQREVDALSAEFIKIGKRDIIVFCMKDELCGDMALDFINAMGTAHWEFDQETPWSDKTKGIGVSDPDVLAAIKRAAPRLPVSLIQSNMPPGRIALVIGAKS